jgi:CRISPR/Cas system CMR subunit Cmr4 (Cas7 group RAMP superfamily)
MNGTTLADAFWAGGRSRYIQARIVVEGDLVLLTPAHFGNGDGSDETDLPLLTDALEPEHPLLTGASLAGALRAYLKRFSGGDAQFDTALFGGGKGDDDGEQSPLIADDALGSKGAAVELRDGVKLDPASRTAADKALFNIETWAAGTTFPLRLELVLIDDPKKPDRQEAALRALATALTGLSNGSITLGARKRRGYGQARVAQWRVRRFNLAGSADDLLSWLRDGNAKLDGSAKTVATVNGGGSLLPDHELMTALLRAFGSAAQPIANQEHVFTLSAEFSLESSLLIRGNTGKDDLGPDMVHLHSRRNGKNGQQEPVPILSGTSLAGALRGRATRILNTLTQDKTDQIIADMFGPEMKGKVTPRASRVIVEECEIVNAVTDLVQNRIRIDRFTGGVMEGALFSEQPAFGKKETRLTIRLRLLDPMEHEIGLLLLLLKDLWTGDLPLGGEISVGRGRLRGRSATQVWRRGGEGQSDEWRIERVSDDPSESHLNITGDQAMLERFISVCLRRELFGEEVSNGA